MYSHLVLSGGGMKGICFVSALQRLKINIPDLTSISGTSIGSVIGLLLIVGYTPDTLLQVLLDTDYKKLCDVSYKNFLTDFGLDTGKGLIHWLINLLAPKMRDITILAIPSLDTSSPSFVPPFDYRQVTFLELYLLYGKQFNVAGVKLNTHSLVYFNHKNTPEVRVLDAIRVSVSFPFLFTKCTLGGDLYVDGGVLDNFPVDAIDSPGKILGLRITPDNIPFDPSSIQLDTYTTEVINCLLIQIYKLEKQKRHSKKLHVIDITTSSSILIDHNITKDTISKLLADGDSAVKQFLHTSALKAARI